MCVKKRFHRVLTQISRFYFTKTMTSPFLISIIWCIEWGNSTHSKNYLFRLEGTHNFEVDFSKIHLKVLNFNNSPNVAYVRAFLVDVEQPLLHLLLAVVVCPFGVGLGLGAPKQETIRQSHSQKGDKKERKSAHRTRRAAPRMKATLQGERGGEGKGRRAAELRARSMRS